MPYLILILWIVAILCFLIKNDQSNRFFKKKTKQLNKMLQSLKNDYKNHEITETMKEAGIPIDLYRYQILRISIVVLILLASFIAMFKGENGAQIRILFAIVIFILTTPKQKMLGRKTLFQLMIDLSMERKREMFNQELYIAISQLKTTFLNKKERPPSSDYILEQVRKYTNKTKDIFNHMLSIWMIGEKEAAVEYFQQAIGTKEAKNLGQVFLKLDDLNPIEMKRQLEVYQEIYRLEKETKKLKRNANRSTILFIFIVGCCLMVLINFLTVSFYIDYQKQLFSIL
ncbi:MAG: hypothetical protein Q8934_08935 [Bacillota bacterium]|nr:hypothetical protein [Bacillota bacterium]